jgi:tRNA pseudouridine55 synthase
VVEAVRRGTGVTKVGHAGTLDPRASGVLVLCLGPATRLSEFLSGSIKGYEAEVRFGRSTETYDAEGAAVRDTGKVPTMAQIVPVLGAFRGDIQQVPPPYSAVKVMGKKAYELAREGKPVELEARTVSIYKLEPLEYRPPALTLWVECSAGTYIRSLAHDLGEALSCGGHLAQLRRVRAGPYTLNDAVEWRKFQRAMTSGTWESHLRPAAEALPDLPIVQLRPEHMDRVRNGLSIPIESPAVGLARALSPDGELAAILEAVDGDQTWHPRKVFLA